jgi:HEAT repeat protein
MRCNRWLSGILICAALAWSATANAARAEEAGGDLVSMIVGLLADQDREFRAAALDQIRTGAKGAEATKQFAAQLPKLPAETQIGLLSALGDRGDAAALPAVTELLGSTPDEPVKVAAIVALGTLGGAADYPRLLSLLTSGSKAEAVAARTALLRLRGRAVSTAMVETLKKSGEPALRATLIELVATRRDVDFLPDLDALVLDPDARVRTAAMSALAQLGGPEQVASMVAGVLRAEKGSERDAAERAIVEVCKRIPDANLRTAPVLAAMDKLGPADRAVLLSTLGRMGGAAAAKTVEAAVADPALHEAGVRSLCNWPDASVAPRLIEILNSDPQQEFRGMALQALIRVAPLGDGRSNEARLELLKKVMGLCSRPEDQDRLLKRASAIYTVEALRFVVPYLDQPEHAQAACEAVVELAHHREVRDANTADFMPALDKVIAICKDPTLLERAKRYKAGKTYVR